MISIRYGWISVLIFLAGCHSSKENTHTASLEKNFQHKPNLVIPRGYIPVVNTLHRTTYIGTVDHPTIDGGIINAADGIPVSHVMPIHADQVTTTTYPSKINSESNNNAPVNNQTQFEDSWATSKKVSALLEEAAAQGKLDYVLQKTKQMNLPASVATVPMIESHYQTQTISPKGAAGAWQLMPVIAKEYGIQDQARFQFTPSTDTALQLLDHLHREFGNWTLAFAAYNAGSGRVHAALEENPHAKTIDELNLPSETKRYVRNIQEINQKMMTMENT